MEEEFLWKFFELGTLRVPIKFFDTDTLPPPLPPSPINFEILQVLTLGEQEEAKHGVVRGKREIDDNTRDPGYP